MMLVALIGITSIANGNGRHLIGNGNSLKAAGALPTFDDRYPYTNTSVDGATLNEFSLDVGMI
jgi:hypothetical protein